MIGAARYGLLRLRRSGRLLGDPTGHGESCGLRRSANRFMACNSQFLRVPGGFFCINDRNTTQPLTNVRR